MPSSPPTPQEQASARAAVTATLHAVGSSYDSDLSSRAAAIHASGGSIAQQERDLAKQTAALAKQGDAFEKLMGSTQRGLNEMGDLQNWAEMIERELLVVEETVRLVEGGEERENASGT